MAPGIQRTDTQPRREFQRPQLALPMGRICALDYSVAEDRISI
jgi:hypothetical protein